MIAIKVKVFALKSQSSQPEPVSLKSSDQLVIYQNPLYASQMDLAVDMFKSEYPDVNVDYRYFGDSEVDPNTYHQFNSVVSGELTAGKGPDIIFDAMNLVSADFTKAAASGVFLDLKSIIENDDTIRQDKYLDGTFSAGELDGKTFFVPVLVSPPMMLSNAPWKS